MFCESYLASHIHLTHTRPKRTNKKQNKQININIKACLHVFKHSERNYRTTATQPGIV